MVGPVAKREGVAHLQAVMGLPFGLDVLQTGHSLAQGVDQCLFFTDNAPTRSLAPVL
jgi:hypothetical protein